MTEARVHSPGPRQYCAAVVGTVTGAIRSRAADQHFLDGLSDAGLPTASATVTLTSLEQVPKLVPTAFVVEGRRHPSRIRMAMRAFVVEHPDATFVVDPSLCDDVEHRALNELPAILRLGVRPPQGVMALGESLAAGEVATASLDFALPTHLHWDHVSGLLDFPELPVRLNALEYAWAMAGELAPVGGVRSSLIGRRIETYELTGPAVLTFEHSHDLFGDGSVTIVDLPGHTPGHVGVLLNTASGWVLLAGDAAWNHFQIDDIRQKTAYPGVFADVDRDEAFRSLHRLHALGPEVTVVPTHDFDKANALRPR